MTTYKITLRTGQTATIEDDRSLGALAKQLAHEGFIVVRRLGTGYSQATTEMALLERAVESIEAVG